MGDFIEWLIGLLEDALGPYIGLVFFLAGVIVVAAVALSVYEFRRARNHDTMPVMRHRR